MQRFEPLSSLILAILAGRKKPITRYEVMTIVNQATTFVSHPYSPGAVYHQIKQLEAAKMIKFNQKSPEVTPSGRIEIRQRLLSASRPGSIFETVAHLLCLSLVNDSDIRKEGMQRLRVEMIKNNQFEEDSDSFDHDMSAFYSAMKDCRSELNKAIGRSILNIGA